MNLRFSIVSFLPFLLLAPLVAGCFQHSDWTRGDDGQTQWQLYDGLCPASGCDLDVPVSPDQDITLTVKGIDMTGLHASAGATSATFTPSTDEPTHATLQFRTGAAGDVPLVLATAAGVERGRSTFHVRVPTALACGLVPGRNSPDWKLTGVETSDALTVSLASVAADDGYIQVACRATDAAGPIMTRYGIDWNTDSATSIELHADFSATPYRSGSGARVRIKAVAVGSTVVHLQIGTVTHDVTIAVTP